MKALKAPTLPRLAGLLAVVLALSQTPVRAADPACPDAELFSGKLITDVCWACLFPIRIAGMPLFGGTVPAGAASAPFCACNDGLGVPHPGFTVGMWEPARLIELVHAPRCARCISRPASIARPAGRGFAQSRMPWTRRSIC